MKRYDALVIGGGLVGSAIAFGFAREGQKVALVDEGDAAFRSARGNFGQVWVQGKGVGCPAYHRWTRLSADLWAGLAEDLEERTGVNVDLAQPGGFSFMLSEQEWRERDSMMNRLKNEVGDFGFDFQMMDRAETDKHVSGLGPQVLGSCFTAYDGEVNPLYLLRALHAAIQGLGGEYHGEARATTIEAAPRNFTVRLPTGTLTAPVLVLACGLGILELAPQVGLDVPIRPQRGQILVTERLRPFLTYPTGGVRQTAEGTVLMGASREEVGFNDRTLPDVSRMITSRAIAMFPLLDNVAVVRTWGCLRVLTPDENPLYQQSERFPGAFVTTCHSGVTLAAVHAYRMPECLRTGIFPDDFLAFSSERFHVQSAA